MNLCRASAIALIWAAIAVSGCGDGPSIDGEWASEWRTSTSSGALALRLTGNDYVSWDATMTGPATADAQIELGTFTADGGQIVFTPQQSSCALPASHASPYSLTDLTLTAGTTYERRAESPFAGMALRSGCADSGTFVPSPIK